MYFIYLTLTEQTFCLPYINRFTFRFTLLCHTPLLIYLLGKQSTFTYLTLNKPPFYLPYIDPTRCLYTHIYNFLLTYEFIIYTITVPTCNNAHFFNLTLGYPISLYTRVAGPSILVDNLHLLYTFNHNHHGKYQSEEPQRCC